MHVLPPVLLSLGLTVAQVDCDEWERTDRAIWRAEAAATVISATGDFYTFYGGVDASRTSEPDLWATLELFCRAELDGGVR